MTTTQLPQIDVDVTVSAPYRVIGYQGGRYGASQYAKRDYTATVMGRTFKNTSKADIQSRIRQYLHHETGVNQRVVFTFTDSQEG